jgi:hypothetical protein
VPHFPAHLDEYHISGRFGTKDRNRSRREICGSDFFPTDPNITNRCSDRVDEEKLLRLVRAGIGEEAGGQSPNVVTSDILVAKEELDMGSLVKGFVDLANL